MLSNGRVQGALFVSQGDGQHDVETFENLILSQVMVTCMRAIPWKYLHSYASFRVSLRLLNVIALQTYVGDWGEELLEGRVDVADFFD